MTSNSDTAVLVLADGSVFRGRSIGAPGTAVGEVVFNTAMTGYQEILTDPSYCRQIVTLTYPHIGNTGVNPGDEEAEGVRAGIADGTVDIVIATHRILTGRTKFKDLGLLVVDEEQRFGVAQKERLKRMRASVDVLSMSATPIPRTLHMSLGGIRDLSVLATPPEERVPIRTFVTADADNLVREVIIRELRRERVAGLDPKSGSRIDGVNAATG